MFCGYLPQIKKALGIGGVQTSSSSWRSSTVGQGAQIDLVIDRRDQIINLCEMKYALSPYTIDKRYEAELRNKISAFKTETGTRKSVFLTFVSTFGLNENSHSLGLVQQRIVLEQLFEEV